MYDKDWPHGHTYNGTRCRVLATDLRRPDDACSIAIAVMCANGITETVARVAPDDLMPAPTPKKRVQGWLNIYPGPEDGGYHYHSSVFKNKEDANYRSNKHRIACISIDVEEGEGLT